MLLYVRPTAGLESRKNSCGDNKFCVVGWKSLLSFLVRIVANHAIMLLSADLIIGDLLSDCCRDRSVS